MGFNLWGHNIRYYRGLDARGNDKKNLAAGLGLLSTQPGATDTPEQHVGGSTALRSQWISLTKSEAIARATYGKYGVLAVDMDKVTTTVVDCSAGVPGCTSAHVNGYAILDQEVLVKDHIPQDAITILVPPP